MGFSRKKVIVFLLVVFLMMPSIVTAFNPPVPMPMPPGGGDGGASLGFDNPLGDTETFTIFLENVINFLLVLSALLAMLALVWGGIMYITALGNEQRAEQAKKIVFWAVVGISVVLLSYSIVLIVASMVGAPTS